MLPNYQARSPFVLKHTTSLYICLDVRMSFCTLTLAFLLASERSERDTYRGNTIENRGCLLIYLLASERSERDTIRGNSIEISLYIFIYLSVYGVRETSVFARAFNYVS